jgi:hypothetical protein
LPHFVDALDVPFIAIAEVGPLKAGLNKAECIIFRTLVPGLLQEDWLNFCGSPVSPIITVKGAGKKLGSFKL